MSELLIAIGTSLVLIAIASAVQTFITVRFGTVNQEDTNADPSDY